MMYITYMDKLGTLIEPIDEYGIQFNNGFAYFNDKKIEFYAVLEIRRITRMRKFKQYVYSSKSYKDCLKSTAIIAEQNNKDFIMDFDEEIGIYRGHLLVSYEDL